jgi:hypothetical protein
MWRKSTKKNELLWCHLCKEGGHRCSFAERTWGISVCPEVLETKDGIAMRAKEPGPKAQSSQKSTASKKVAAPNETRDSTRSTAEGASSSEHAENPALVEPPLIAGPTPGSWPLTPPTASFWDVTSGRLEQIYFEDLNRYEEGLRAPNKSALSTGSLFLQLQALRSREKSILGQLSDTINGRLELTEQLLMDLGSTAVFSAREESGRRGQSRVILKKIAAEINAALSDERSFEDGGDGKAMGEGPSGEGDGSSL